jgi:uncharacterized membrane protein YccC
MTDLLFCKSLRGLLGRHRSKLRFCLRVTVVGLTAFALGRALKLPLNGIWAVLTAVVVTQMSVGGSLRASLEYMVGTVGGAIYAAIIGVAVPHATPLAEAGVLALTLAPLALAAAVNANFRVAPFSAVLVLLLAGQFGEGPIASAAIRIGEVALGGIVAIVASFLVFPERAQRMGLEAAARILKLMARILPELLRGFTKQLDPVRIRAAQDEIGEAVAGLQAIAAEAKNERPFRLVADPDQGPLSRTLLRIRHDLVIIGRAAAMPLPDAVAQRLSPLLARVGASASDFLLASARALTSRTNPSSLGNVEAALKAYTAEFSLLRREGLTRCLSDAEVEQLFTLSFALDQSYGNFSDLERCVGEFAGSPSGKGRR